MPIAARKCPPRADPSAPVHIGTAPLDGDPARAVLTDRFEHRALLYGGDSGFIDGTAPFIRDALEADEPTLVMVPSERIGLLREELGADSDAVEFADMREVGSNPARIIPAWRAFVARAAAPGNALRGIGEPVWAGRSDAELSECQRHEALLNLAFAADGPFRLLCPYDLETLDDAVIERAFESHPQMVDAEHEHDSDAYAGLTRVAAPFAEPLPEAPADATEMRFDVGTLHDVRALVSSRAADAGITGNSLEGLIVGTTEIAANSVRHGGGSGRLRVWSDPATFVCEVRDRGRLDAPLAGREPPASGQIGGYGLWLANQLCDLMQVRAVDDGTVIRIHTRRN